MNVLFVSQCSKRALTETRRILDQFAERRGDRTWQTPITQAGLDTVCKLLRQSARKNTAVACHWIRGIDHSELLWVVGDARQFNLDGAVPTNATARNVLRSGDENDWYTAQDIRLLAQLAALLHDLGKASVAFQQRLRGRRSERNLYRHEWTSLRLFQAFVGPDDDATWLQRLADPTRYSEADWTANGRYLRDGLDAAARDNFPFQHLPPVAAAVGWLVVTHHRLPVVPVFKKNGEQDWLGKRPLTWDKHHLLDPLALVAHDWNEKRPAQGLSATELDSYWDLAGSLPVVEKTWQGEAARIARRLLERTAGKTPSYLRSPYVMHLARLSLMLADHYYSGLGHGVRRVKGDGRTHLYANTWSGKEDKDARTLQGRLKQPLDEHLLGVGHEAGCIAHALPSFERRLPCLANVRTLQRRSRDARFRWQDKAFDQAVAICEQASTHGAFIVNMASTGCGKTLANARILYALAPRKRLRMTYALGLRTLTLQTGRSYESDLGLAPDLEVATLVGGPATRDLFSWYERQAEETGSASTQALLSEDSHVFYDGNETDHPLLSRVLADPGIRKLLCAPILVSTVDHIVPATESLRGGRQIAPMLRLMSSDLVLDELDDYGLEDMPALTRLVHWAGMLGTRVVLSSATLPPPLVTGMFLAWRAGRTEYLRNRGLQSVAPDTPAEIPCLWVDEFSAHTANCRGGNDFKEQHAAFVAQRVRKLRAMPPLRRAVIERLDITARKPSEQQQAFAQAVQVVCLKLHADHHGTDLATGKNASFGLVRMANIGPLFQVARYLFAMEAPADTRLHLCVYHSRFPLIQRAEIEHMLDAVFNRKRAADGADPVWQRPTVRQALDRYPESNQIFIVLASPVCEVGRDWDADWAVVEPSSMRSIIQLAGRVQRHRQQPCEVPNMVVFDTNLRALGAPGAPAFAKPGYENADFKLENHDLEKLLAFGVLDPITALSRIQLPSDLSRTAAQQSLIALEQARTQRALIPDSNFDASSAPARDAAWVRWKHAGAHLSGVAPQYQPFREENARQVQLAFLPDDDETCLLLHRVEDRRRERKPDLYTCVDEGECKRVPLPQGPRCSAWQPLQTPLMALQTMAEARSITLDACARRFATLQAPDSGQGWLYHPWLGLTQKY